MKHDLSLEELEMICGGMRWEDFTPSNNVEDRRDWTNLGVDGCNGDAYSQDSRGTVYSQPYDVQSEGWGEPRAVDAGSVPPLVNDEW